jgi:nicotinamidase-related amidase
VSELRLRKASDMAESKPVTWRLAPGYLAAGKVNLLVGSEGIGKSLWTVRAMATVTTGTRWGPFTIDSSPADVVLIATEDGWEDTIRPRLEVAEADLDRVHVLCADDDGTGIPNADEAIVALQRDGIRPSLLVVDAWIDTVPGGLQVKDPQKARQAVTPWKEYAAQTEAAGLLVAHTNRLETPDIRNTYGLSGALRQVARSTIYALEDPDDGALLVGPDKSNLGAKGIAHRFIRTPVPHPQFTPTADSDGTVARLDHLGREGKSIQDILTEQVQTTRTAPKTEAIDLWLKGALADGPLPATDLDDLGAMEGYTQGQIRRSRERIGAISNKVGNQWIVKL